MTERATHKPRLGRQAGATRIRTQWGRALAGGLAVFLGAGPAWAASRTVTLVVCAPGYPGSTAEAQPAMDALAAAVAAAAGWQPGELRAVYHEAEEAGLVRLAQPDAAVTLVPLPFWLKHRAALGLAPRLQAIQQGGEIAEAWSLVVPAAADARPSDLAGYQVLSLAGYAPRFVRGPVLGEWGTLPPDVTIRFSQAVLSGLRKASAGAKVAVLLDRAQAAALPSLPYAAKLKVATRSRPLPVAVLCTVGERMPAARRAALVKALAALGSRPGEMDVLAGVRMRRFVAVDQQALDAARAAFEAVER